MNIFRNKLFKNELDPKYAFYDSLGGEFENNYKNSPEECVENYELRQVPNNLDD